MTMLKVGEKDRDGRQKRIEHTGRYLRASRTGGLSLRAQTRAGDVTVSAKTPIGSFNWIGPGTCWPYTGAFSRCSRPKEMPPAVLNPPPRLRSANAV